MGGTYLRGGSWDSVSTYLRAAYRYSFDLDFRYDFIGFRCVREEDATNPFLPVVHGGSWKTSREDTPCAERNTMLPVYSAPRYGFRVVREE